MRLKELNSAMTLHFSVCFIPVSSLVGLIPVYLQLIIFKVVETVKYWLSIVSAVLVQLSPDQTVYSCFLVKSFARLGQLSVSTADLGNSI